MSYGKWRIDEEFTFKEFGYYSKELSKGSTKPVKCICECCGIISNKRFRESNRKHICKSIIDGKKKCYKCKEIKLIEDFSKNRSNFDGYQKVCKECFSNYGCVKVGYSKKSKLIKSDLKTYFRNKHSFFKKKCEKKNIEFNLSKDYLYELYLKQSGKCFYTEIDIIHNVGCHQFNSISVDRVDPNKGYTEDNIVLSSFAINSFKGMFNEYEYKNFLNIVIPKLIEYKDN